MHRYDRIALLIAPWKNQPEPERSQRISDFIGGVIDKGYWPITSLSFACEDYLCEEDCPADREIGLALSSASIRRLRPGIDVVVVRGWTGIDEKPDWIHVTKEYPGRGRAHHFVSEGMAADLDQVPKGVKIIWGDLPEAESVLREKETEEDKR